MLNRRNFLLKSCAGLGVASGLATNLGAFNAFAADTSDYKALVCIFLFGGMDGHDTVIPYDQSSYNNFESVREVLLSNLDNSLEGFASRRRNALLPLNGSVPDGRQFAFAEEYRPLHELYQSGNAAVIGNVGPLIEPTTRTTYRNDTAALPARLFSHNDQQSTWMASQPEGASSGWGGRFGDIMDAANANSNSAFTTVSASGSSVFLTGDTVTPFTVSTSGALSIDRSMSNNVLGSAVFSENYLDGLQDINGVPKSLFGADVVDVMKTSIGLNDQLDTALEERGDLNVAFPASGLGSQLNIVARMIASRFSLGVNRQIFFVTAGGFDTHSNQAGLLPGLQADIAASMRAFYDAMVDLGVSNEVTTFTASDFGRTLTPNSSGTDHGWGSHHVVMGGAVNGGQIYGDIPVPEFNHEYDTGRGRLIPQSSVEQYAGALGRWFGLSDSELREAMPGLQNFDQNQLTNLFSSSV